MSIRWQSNIFAFLPFLILAIGLCGCGGDDYGGNYSDDDSMEDEGDHSDEPPPPKKEVAATAEMTVSVQEMYDAYRADREAAAAKYNGKTVEISGEVSHFSLSKSTFSEGKMVLMFLLPPNAKLGESANVRCAMPGKNPWELMSVGDNVTLRAVVDITRDYGLEIGPCIIESNDGGPMPVMEAADLAKRVVEDAAAARAEFADKTYVVTGKVVRLASDESVGVFTAHVILEGEGEVEFAVSTPDPRWDYDYLKPGDEFTVIGIIIVPKEPKEGEHNVGLQFGSCLTTPPKK